MKAQNETFFPKQNPEAMSVIFGATRVESVSRVLLRRSSSKAGLSSSDRQRIGF